MSYRRILVGVCAAVLVVGVVTVKVVDQYVVNTGSKYWRLGYQIAGDPPGGQNPLKLVPEEKWDAVSEREKAECEEDWESPEVAPGPDWEDYCAGLWEGYVDWKRGTYVPLEEKVSWGEYDYD